jgi:hypothetical protein
MTNEAKNMSPADNQEPVLAQESQAEEQQVDNLGQRHSSKLVRFYAHPWTQIMLISFICFCLPGVSDSKLRTLRQSRKDANSNPGAIDVQCAGWSWWIRPG